MESLLQDLRYAGRMLRKTPVFTTVAVLTLALAIGANTAIFSLIDALLLRPLPVKDPGQLAAVLGTGERTDTTPLSLNMYRNLRQQQKVFAELAGWEFGGVVDLSAGGGTMRPGTICAVTGNFFSLLGITPVLGRPISDSDAQLGAPPVMVISYRFWREEFHSDPAVLGKVVTVQDIPFTVIGVAPRPFFGLWVGVDNDVYVPVTTAGLYITGADFDVQTSPWMGALGRLQSGVSLEQAQAQMEALWPGLIAEASASMTPGQRRYISPKVLVQSLETGFSPALRSRFSRPLYMLMLMVVLVLVIACVNLATLVLARAAARRHEMAMRIALGGSARRIMRQLLTETLLLSAAGAVPGVVAAIWASRVLAKFVWTGFVPLALDTNPDQRVLLFSIAATVLTGVLFGLVPGWHAGRHNPGDVLRFGSRIAGSATGRWGRALVAMQVVISMVLLAAAWAVLGNLKQLRSMDLGYEPHHLMSMFLMNRPGGYRNLDFAVYDRALMQAVEAVPGVESEALAFRSWPVQPTDFPQAVFDPSNPSAPTVTAIPFAVSPGFFRTLRIPLLQGRDFNWQDDEQAPAVAIISEELARTLFPGGALGQRISFVQDPSKRVWQISGVAANSRLGNARNAYPQLFLAAFQQPKAMLQPMLIARTPGDPRTIIEPVRHAVEGLGREFPLRISTLDAALDELFLPERVMAILAGFFGGLALLLAVIGLYGLMSYNVSLRTAEIGVRMALGAERRDVLRLVVREASTLALTGIAIGIPAAWACMRLLSGVVEHLGSGWVPLAGAALVLITAAVGAAIAPARRASKVDPMVSLRYE